MLTWSASDSGWDCVDTLTGEVIGSAEWDGIEHGWMIDGDRDDWHYYLSTCQALIEARVAVDDYVV